MSTAYQHETVYLSGEITVAHLEQVDGLPKDLAQALKAYETRLGDYLAANDTRADAEAALDTAAAADQASLVDAIAAGTEHPGTPATDKAVTAARFATARLQQAAQGVTAAADLARQRAGQHSAAVLEAAARHELATLERYRSLIAEAQALVTQAQQLAMASGHAIEEAAALIGIHTRATVLAPWPLSVSMPDLSQPPAEAARAAVHYRAIVDHYATQLTEGTRP